MWTSAVSGDLHEGEKFLTTRRHPSLLLDGTCVTTATGSEAGLGVLPSDLVSVPVSTCWPGGLPGTAGALTAGLSMGFLWYQAVGMMGQQDGSVRSFTRPIATSIAVKGWYFAMTKSLVCLHCIGAGKERQ